MTSTTVLRDAPARAPRTPARRTAYVGLVATVAVVVGRLPFLTIPASPDEGGYLLVAAQWHPGSSLYGDYWLARPPLLVGINALAAACGGTVALRLIGTVAILACVLLAMGIAREVARAMPTIPSALSSAVPVAVVVIFLSTPLFGTTHVDGELLAAPFVLAGVLACLRAATASHRAGAVRWWLLAGAGAAATSAAMVKQNSIDVFVFVGACLVLRLVAGERRAALRAAAVFSAGALAAATVILGVATLRGTGLGELWSSVVTFRLQASSALGDGAPEVNTVRLHHLVAAAAVSLAPVVVAVLAWQSRGRPSSPDGRAASVPDLRWPAYALLAWEVVSIAGGGSFWLHYLVDLVPGMTVLAVAALQRPPSASGALTRTLTWALAAAALSWGTATVVATIKGPDYSSDAETIDYLRDHARPGDTATVAFGAANILWDAGLSSPYEQLWSLPTRVRDSHLRTFSSMLTSPSAPTWVVVAGRGLYSWGLDVEHADRVLEARYHRVADEGTYVIWHLDDSTRG